MLVEKRKEVGEELHIILQPTRRKVIENLKLKGSMYIEKIAKSIKEDRKNVVFHLMTLKENGFVDYDLGIIDIPNPSKGRAGKFYKLTEKGFKAAEIIEKLFNEYAK